MPGRNASASKRGAGVSPLAVLLKSFRAMVDNKRELCCKCIVVVFSAGDPLLGKLLSKGPPDNPILALKIPSFSSSASSKGLRARL